MSPYAAFSPMTDTVDLGTVWRDKLHATADETTELHLLDLRPPVTRTRRLRRAAVNAAATVGALYTAHVALVLAGSAIWL